MAKKNKIEDEIELTNKDVDALLKKTHMSLKKGFEIPWDVMCIQDILLFVKELEKLLAIKLEVSDKKWREKIEKVVKEFDEMLDFYSKHTKEEHSEDAQRIVQNIQSDFINKFEEYLK